MLTQVEIMAVSKVIKEAQIETARKDLKPGKYPVDLTVRLSGWVNVGEDTEKKSTSSIINEAFLILVLKKAGFMREQAAMIIKEVATDCLKDWTGSNEDRENAKAKRDAMVMEFDPNGSIRIIMDEIKGSIPKTPVRGSVSFKGSVMAAVGAQASDVAVEQQQAS